MNADEKRHEDGRHLVTRMLELIGEKPREGIRETPDRVVRSWDELFRGYREDPARHLTKRFATTSSQMVHVNGIDFFSTCEHHMLPFHGTVDVAYLPEKEVVGLSKIARLVDGFARRLQIQEQLTEQIADTLANALPTRGVAVRVRAVHLCMLSRGARSNGQMVTTALRGIFLDDATVRAEWLASLPP